MGLFDSIGDFLADFDLSDALGTVQAGLGAYNAVKQTFAAPPAARPSIDINPFPQLQPAPGSQPSPWPLTSPGSSSWWLRPLGEPAPGGPMNGATGTWPFVGPQGPGTRDIGHPAMQYVDRRGMPRVGCEPGYHVTLKSKYSPGAPWCVRNRHMNPLNYRAARRAIRRLHMAEKLCRKIVRFVAPQKARGRAKFPFKRSSRSGGRCKTKCR